MPDPRLKGHNHRMFVLSFFVMTALFSSVLFLPALREIRSKSDAQCLHIEEAFEYDIVASERLKTGSTFTRLFGEPIMTECVSGKNDAPQSFLRDPDRFSRGLVVSGGARLHEDIISEKSIRVGADAVVIGSIKSHGSLEILQGARVFGNIFARAALHLHPKVMITGTVYGEGDVRCEDLVQIGTPSAYVSVFSGGTMSISRGVRIYGWIVAEGGGTVW